MPTLLFYKNPIPIDRLAHRAIRVKFQAKGFRFAKNTNSIPAILPEFGSLCLEYPIVFINDATDGGIPVVLTGLRDTENLFVDENGKWDATYVPAFVRRYPFVLQTANADGNFNVLFDTEADELIAPDGEKLFSDDGANLPLLDTIVESLHHFNEFASQTADFVQQLRKLDLLIPRIINGVSKSGKTLQMNGFSVVDEERLKALDDAALLTLARSGHLAFIHAHLISLTNIQQLMTRLHRIDPA